MVALIFQLLAFAWFGQAYALSDVPHRFGLRVIRPWDGFEIGAASIAIALLSNKVSAPVLRPVAIVAVMTTALRARRVSIDRARDSPAARR